MLLGALPAFVLLLPVPNKLWGHLRTWMSLLCLGHATVGSSPPIAGTTMAPVSSEPPGHRVTAPAKSSHTETGRVAAHLHSEESIMTFTLRLLDGECSGGVAGKCWGGWRGETMGWGHPKSVPSPGWPRY